MCSGKESVNSFYSAFIDKLGITVMLLLNIAPFIPPEAHILAW